MNIPIVYEDDWLVILDKPSGLLTIPALNKDARCLTGILNQDLKERNVAYRLHPCHRLDRETSGLIIYSKGKSIQEKMMQLFKFKKIKKSYIAFLSGTLLQSQGQINRPIDGQSALTLYTLIEQRKDFAIVQAQPFTGRTNQLRLHFKYIGHPILGESKFAFRKDFKIKAKRLCLHAAYLEFIHPVTNKNIEIKSTLPKDLTDFLENHKN